MRFELLLSFYFVIFLISCNSNEQSNSLKSSLPADSFAIKEKLLETDSLNFPLREELAIKYYNNNNNLNKAIYHFIKLCQNDKNNKLALTTLGNIYYDSQQFSNAIEYYEKALKLDSLNTNLRCDLATSFLNINNANKALELLKENIKIDYNHLQSHHNISVVYKKLGKTKESVVEMEIFNKLQKNN